MNPILAELTMTKPAAIGVGVAALLVLYVAFKVSKFLMKMFLLLVALAAFAAAGWWYYTAHHGSM